MRQLIINLYSFEELSEEAKQNAIETCRSVNVGHEWYDYTFDDAKAIGAILGIDIDRIYFSGFSSQGDGACFEGTYSYTKNSVRDIMDYAPEDKELHLLAKRLFRLQRTHFFGIEASIKHSGHYYHPGCTTISSRWYVGGEERYDDTFEGDLEDLLRDFMYWIYKQLETEYDYRTSDEAVIDTMKVNEYEFHENGNVHIQLTI